MFLKFSFGFELFIYHSNFPFAIRIRTFHLPFAFRTFHLPFELFICHSDSNFPFAICHSNFSFAIRTFHLPFELFICHSNFSFAIRTFHLSFGQLKFEPRDIASISSLWQLAEFLMVLFLQCFHFFAPTPFRFLHFINALRRGQFPFSDP